MADLTARIAALVGTDVAATRSLGGGSLSDVLGVDLADGRRVVAKRDAGVAREARMLTAMAATGCPVPAVLGQEDDLLVMSEVTDGGRPDANAWAAAGRAVATLHDGTGAGYGWSEDHAFGDVAIRNDRTDDWPTFWAERRLRPLARGLGDLGGRIEALADGAHERLPAKPRPALLHGDLWAGNVHFGPGGFSGLIDPACYYGDGEVDLAMLTLFGRPGTSFFDAYGPLDDGWERRRPVYQLWPALVHLHLFGSAYRGMVDACLAEAGA